MRAFLTGSSGFVGGHLRRHLQVAGDELGELAEEIDLAVPDERGRVGAALAEFAPEVVYHLAALTHVGRSWENPSETMRVNVLGTVELLEACRALPRPPKVLLVSSAEVYGIGDGVALSEVAPLRPLSPYAASKVAAEYVGLQANLGRGLDVVRVRPFNHVGPGQADAFVVPALARRVVEAERSGATTVAVGNLAAARDFTDVRDVVAAYRLLAERGVAGEVYNVCSGTARTVAEVLDGLLSLARIPLEAKAEPSLFRPVEVPLLLGDGTKLAELTGWRPQIPFTETLDAVLESWRKALADG